MTDETQSNEPAAPLTEAEAALERLALAYERASSLNGRQTAWTAFIRAVTPATVLGLLAVIRELREQDDRWQAMLGHLAHQAGQAQRAAARLRAQLAEAEAARAAVTGALEKLMFAYQQTFDTSAYTEDPAWLNAYIAICPVWDQQAALTAGDGGWIAEKVGPPNRELAQWQQYAAYLRSCALSGEHDPHDFQAFVERTDWGGAEGSTQ